MCNFFMVPLQSVTNVTIRLENDSTSSCAPESKIFDGSDSVDHAAFVLARLSDVEVVPSFVEIEPPRASSRLVSQHSRNTENQPSPISSSLLPSSDSVLPPQATSQAIMSVIYPQLLEQVGYPNDVQHAQNTSIEISGSASSIPCALENFSRQQMADPADIRRNPSLYSIPAWQEPSIPSHDASNPHNISSHPPHSVNHGPNKSRARRKHPPNL